MSGTNGKTDPRITAVMADLQRHEAALAQLDAKRKELEGKVADAERALATAQQHSEQCLAELEKQYSPARSAARNKSQG